MKKNFAILFIALSFLSFGAENSLFDKSLKEYFTGVLLSSRGDCEKAVSHFEKALELNKDIYIYFELANCYKSLSELEKTADYLEKAVKEFPDNPLGYLKLADYYAELYGSLRFDEVLKKANENYKKAFELSGDFKIIYDIIETDFILKNYDNVLNYFEMLPDSYKKDDLTLLYVSAVYNEKKDRFNLFKTLRLVSKSKVQSPKILNEFVQIAMSNGFYIYAFKFSLNIASHIKDYADWDRCLIAGMLAGKYEKVIELFESKVKDKPTSLTYYAYATSLAYLHRYKEALKYYDIILHDKNYALSDNLVRDVYLDYIKLLLITGDYRKAYKETLSYEKIFGLSPDEIIKERFVSLILLKDFKKAKKVLYILKLTSKNKKLVELLEKRFEKFPMLIGYDYLAFLYSSMKDDEKAIYYYKKCIKYETDKDLKSVYLSNLALAYDRVGDLKNAEKIYKKLLKDSPDNPLILNNYGYMLVKYDLDLEKGFEMVKKAVELQPESPSYRDSLGLAYLKKNELEKAEENFLYAYKTSPMNPEICLHLGDLYFKKGDFEKAKDFWQDAEDFGYPDVKEIENRFALIDSD